MKLLIVLLITIIAATSCSSTPEQPVENRTKMMKVDKYWMISPDSAVYVGRSIIRLDTLYNVGDTIVYRSGVADYKQVVVSK